MTSDKRPITLIDNVKYEGNEEDCYEEMDEEEEEEAEYLQSTSYDGQPEEQHLETDEVNCEATLLGVKPTCLVCGSPEEKYHLFKWPSDRKTRRTWANALDIHESMLDEDSHICAFHFPSAHFAHSNGQTYYEKCAFPTYKFERPSNELPFPCEMYRSSGRNSPRSHIKLFTEHDNYSVKYRQSYYKNKNRNAHLVAVVTKMDSNILYEFAYNRTSPVDGSKFYSCLGCRKAKADSKAMNYDAQVNVIRTIHISVSDAILSKGDPFEGHHSQCQPFNGDIIKSYRPNIPQPMHMDMGLVYAPSDDVIYMDDDGNHAEGVWDNAESEGLLNIEHIPFYGEFPMSEPEIKVSQKPQPFSSLRYSTATQRTGARSIPKCHICFRVLSTTANLIAHLQVHLNRPQRPSRSWKIGNQVAAPSIYRANGCSK